MKFLVYIILTEDLKSHFQVWIVLYLLWLSEPRFDTILYKALKNDFEIISISINLVNLNVITFYKLNNLFIH